MALSHHNCKTKNNHILVAMNQWKILEYMVTFWGQCYLSNIYTAQPMAYAMGFTMINVYN